MTAQSWYKDFTRRLNATNTRVAQAPSNTLSISDVARVQLGEGFDPYSKLAGGRNPIGAGEHLLDWGGRALDVLSRPGYAVGGALNAALENKGGNVDLPKELWEGLSGKDKRFFQPAELIDPSKPNDSLFEKGGKWVVDFLAAVATDPVSYVPGAAIARGLKAGADVTGITKAAGALKAGNKPAMEEDFLRSLQDQEAFKPFAEIADKPFQLPKELTATPADKIYKDRAPFVPEEVPASGAPYQFPWKINEPSRQIEAPPRIGQVDPVPEGFVGPQGATMPEPTVHAKPDNFEEMAQKAVDFTGGLRKPAGLSERDHLQVLNLVRDGISRSLRSIKGTFNSSEIKSPWRTVANDAELPTEPIRPDLPEPSAASGQPLEQSVYANAVKRHMADAANHMPDDAAALKASIKNPDKDYFVPSTQKYYWGGQEQSINAFIRDPELNGIGDLSTQEGLMAFLKENPGASVKVAPTYNSPPSMRLAQYVQMFNGGKIPKTEIAVGDKSMPISKYVAAKSEEWGKRAGGGDRAAYDEAMGKYNLDKEAYDKAFENYSPVSKAKPTREDLSNFLRDNKIVLSKAEKKKLLNSANLGEKSFLGTLSKLAAEERRLNVESLDELADMVKSGRVDKSVLDNIYTKLGVTTLGQAKKRLEVMDNAISRLQEKDFIRTKQELATDAARKIDAPVSEGGFNPALVGEVPREIPDPKIPLKEVQQTLDKVPSTSVSEAAVDRATTPDIAALLDDEAKNRVFLAAKQAVNYEWKNWKQKYPHKTNRGAGRTDTTPGAGNAHWYGEFNAKKQYTFFKYALQHVSSAAGKAGVSLKGAEGATLKYNKVMPMLKAHDDLLRTYGIHPSAVPGGGYPVSLFDVLSILPQKWVERHVFNTGRQVTVDQLMHIAQAAVDTRLVKAGPTEWGDELQHVATDLSGFSETVRGILGSRWSDKNVGAKAEDFADKIGDKAGQRELNKTAKKHGFDAEQPPSNFVRDANITGQKVAEKTFNKGTLGDIVNEDFIRAIQEKVAYNSARAEIQYGKFVKKSSKQQVDQFIEAVTAAKTNDEVFKVIDGARKSVNSTLEETATIVPTKAAAAEVKDSVDLATMSNAATDIAVRQMQAFRSSNTTLKAAKAEQEVAKSLDDFVEHLVPTYDLGERAQMGLMARLVHSVVPSIAEGDLRKIMLNNNVTAGHITAQYSRQLSNFQRRVGTEKANQLFNDVRLGYAPNPAEAADYAEMQKIIARIFDDGDPNGWSLAGNGIHPGHLNANLRHFQVHENFKLPTSGTKDEIYGAWRDFEANDPLDLLSRYHAAVQKTIAEKNLGAQASNYFGSAHYKPGLAKVKVTSGSRIAHLINTELYYTPETIQNMFALDKTLKELAAPNNTNKMLRLYDSVTHSYKAGLTIYRPGHHMRNLYGDIWLGAMDGVYNPRFYKRAKAVMATRKEHYTDYNFDASLSDLSGNQGTAVTMKVGGREVHLTNDDVYRLAAKHGLLPNYSTIEDLNVGTKGGDLGEMMSKVSPFGGKVHDAAADISEYRDHWVRLAHFIKVLEDSRNIKSAGHGRQATLNAIDEVAARASNRVQKWHPNGADNTKFERNVLRRGVLFYSWIRKAIPLVVETAVLHPGRFLAFPKAMYTLAESNGIDLNGFSDPFPTDQLFPAWLGGNQGPQFGSHGSGYIGMRMGVPMMDILDQYFTDPGQTFQTIMGATNPLVKMPYELATGTTTQGVPVDDKAKYLLGQVPFGNFVNTMVGKPIGGVSPSDEGYDPGGIRDPKALATINLLTGLGLMDMSKPSYIKSGEFDVKYGRQGG